MDEHFEGDSALYVIVDEDGVPHPKQMQDEDGDWVNIIGTPHGWARPPDIYQGSEVVMAAPEQPMCAITQGEVGHSPYGHQRTPRSLSPWIGGGLLRGRYDTGDA